MMPAHAPARKGGGNNGSPGRTARGTAAIVLALTLGLSASGGTTAHAAADGESKLLVVASILPLADFARQVGGDRVRVELLVPPGQNPHSFSLKPSQMALLSRARLVVLNGLGLEHWADVVVAAARAESRVISVGEHLGSTDAGGAAGANHPAGNTEGRPADPSRGSGQAGWGRVGNDPHVWLDPVQAMEMVRRIETALAAADPDHAATYFANGRRYRMELARLHEEYRRTLEPARGKSFVAFHAGYGHLARRYGLREVSILRASSEGEPSPARIAEAIRTVRRLGVRVIFAEPQFPARAARLIAEEGGAILATLDPIGTAGRESYLELMRENLRQLAKALR